MDHINVIEVIYNAFMCFFSQNKLIVSLLENDMKGLNCMCILNMSKVWEMNILKSNILQ